MPTFTRLALTTCCAFAIACSALETAAVLPPGSGSPSTPMPGGSPPSSSPLPSVRIAAGATSPFTDPAGNVWSPDDGFTGGVGISTDPAIAIDGTDAPTLYNHERYGADASPFHYHFDLPAGDYTVTLKFAETYATDPGQRRFDVAINGDHVLADFDIYAAAGGMNRAVDESFPVTLGAAGAITLELLPGAVQNPKVNAIAIVGGSPPPAPPGNPPPVAGATAGSWQSATINGMPYALLMPAQYDASHAYPLVLYLHQLANEAAIPQQCDPWFNDLSFRAQHPAIVVAPRCIGSSATYNWGGVDSGPQPCQDNAIALVKQIMKTYAVDPKRVYVTGNSMGGLGSWDVIIKYTSLFAAAMPLAGANYYQNVSTVAQALRDVPIWAIHGAQDGQVPLAWDRNLYAAISALGGIEKYTEIGNLGHDVWDTVYPDATYWSWLFAQSR